MGWSSLIEVTLRTTSVAPSSRDDACDAPRREFEVNRPGFGGGPDL